MDGTSSQIGGIKVEWSVSQHQLSTNRTGEHVDAQLKALELPDCGEGLVPRIIGNEEGRDDWTTLPLGEESTSLLYHLG